MSERRRMNAYYYQFEETGSDPIDIILSAVACAGKAFHHTEEWSTHEVDIPYESCHRGKTAIDWIQNAANDAAAVIARLQAALAQKEEQIERLIRFNERAESGFVSQLDHQRELVAALTTKLEAANAALRDLTCESGLSSDGLPKYEMRGNPDCSDIQAALRLAHDAGKEKP